MKEADASFTNLLVSVTKLQSDVQYIIGVVNQSKTEWHEHRKLGISHYMTNSTAQLKEINEDLATIKEDIKKNNKAYDDLSNKIKWINFELKSYRWSALLIFILALFIRARYITFHIEAEKIIPLFSFYGSDIFFVS